jgi:succinyl-CoA synthetase beta subunit
MKAQVLAGGRGLGTFTNGFKGGVHTIIRPGMAAEIASKMLGHNLITKQTGAEGKRCDKVYLMQRLYMRRECYLSIMLDRGSNGPVIIASSKGGTSIEDVAAATPEAITKVPVTLADGPSEQQLAALADFCQVSPGKTTEQFKGCVRNLWRMFVKTDASLVEVNPLAETPDGDIFVCDAKINFDDNAAFRQKDIFAKRDFSQEDPREVEASKWDLNYIGLDGNIGCMVNGAGLAMATMDIIKLYGGTPANFLDVGGGATAEQVTHAFEILNSDSRVQAILVNIFGGIMRCDVIAQGVVSAAQKIGLKKPVVLRLQGTNVKEAKALLDASGYKIISVDDLDKAAETVVKIADIKKQAEAVSLGVSSRDARRHASTREHARGPGVEGIRGPLQSALSFVSPNLSSLSFSPALGVLVLPRSPTSLTSNPFCRARRSIAILLPRSQVSFELPL